MKNEIFVIQLLGSSARARAVAAPVLGDMAQVDLLRALRNPRPVRPAGSTTTEALFDDLAARMRREFSPPGPPDRVTVEHLRALAHPEIQREVARALGYRPEALLPTVFDADRLGHTLETIGSGTDDSGDAEGLYLRLLERLPLIDVQFGLGSGNWTHFIEQQRWITATAAEKLRTIAGNDHLGQDAPAPQVLAYLIERAGRPPAGQAEVYFDAFALIELRRRLAFLGEQLRDEAMDRAELAAQFAPDLRAVTYLPAWLQLYEFGSIASGMLTLFTGAISFAELLPPDLHDPPAAVTGEPVSSEGLLVKNEAPYGHRFQRRESFDIACMVHGEEEPQTILHCKGLSKNQGAQVKDVVQRLTGGDLSITGDSAGARLLNTRVPVQEGLAGHLRAALHRYGAEAVQCAILTGLQQPVNVPTPWHDQLNAEIPYQGLHTGEDAWMPSCIEVMNELTSSVQDSPHGEIPLKILMPGSGGAPYLDKDSPGSPGERAQRRIPTVIYLNDGGEHRAVEAAFAEVMNAIGLDIGEQYPPVTGSWLRRGVAHTRQALTSQELKDQLAKIERALQMPVLLKPQAEIDGQVGCAVAQLITALTSEKNAIIQAGSILLIKVNGDITVRNLTQVEMAYLERNPTLLTAPAAMLDQLQQLNRGEYYPT